MRRTRMTQLLCALVLGLSVGCGDAPGAVALSSSSAGVGQVALSTRCSPETYVASAPAGFEAEEHTELSRRTPHHAAQDIIISPDARTDVTAWFDYGLLMRPMRDERVHVYSARCPLDQDGPSQPWHFKTDVWTGSCGQARVHLDPKVYGFGRVRLLFEMAGDATQAESDVWIVPKDTHFVVFDIDATLSVNNRSFMREIAEHLIDETFWPKAYEGAQALTHLWLAKGYLPIYLTNRPHQLADITRQWLKLNGFAEGPLLVSTLWQHLIPSISGAGAYKEAILTRLKAQGYQIDYAYGNEPTDIYAYQKAQIEPSHIFSIGAHKGLSGTTPVEDSYREHLVTIQALLDRDGHNNDDAL